MERAFGIVTAELTSSGLKRCLERASERFILARWREAPAQIRRALLKVCFPPDSDCNADISAGPSRAIRRQGKAATARRLNLATGGTRCWQVLSHAARSPGLRSSAFSPDQEPSGHLTFAFNLDQATRF